MEWWTASPNALALDLLTVLLVTVRVFLTVLGLPRFMSTYMSAVKTATGDMLWTDTVTSN